MRLLISIGFLGGWVLSGCNVADEEPSSDAKMSHQSPAATQANHEASTKLEALSGDEAEEFVNGWCGGNLSGLINLRQLDAEEYLLSAEAPSWLNYNRESSDEPVSSADQDAVDQKRREAQEKIIAYLKENPVYNAMLPTGKMILAEFSSGNGCRNTLIAIDTLAAAYLKRLADTSSPNAPTCKRKSNGDFHRLSFVFPSVQKVLGVDDEDDGLPNQCSHKLAIVFVGHASTGTLVVSATSNPTLNGDKKLRTFEFELKSFIFEADGSAQFYRSDGAEKIVYRNLLRLY